MTVWFDCLLRPGHYKEVEVQRAIKQFWPYLFPNYELLYRIRDMPSTWLPDIVAVERDSEFGSILIIELKGKPPSSPLDAAVAQVVRYGKEFHKQHPAILLRLVVIGPWRAAKSIPIIEHHGYSVLALQIQRLSHVLTVHADNLLAWATDYPRIGESITQLEDFISGAGATTAEEEGA